MKSLTKAEMAALDHSMESIGIDVPCMMELAGFFVALTAAKISR